MTLPAVSAPYLFSSVMIVTGGGKSFPTLPVVIPICAAVVIVAAVIFLGGVYIWYRKRKAKHDGNVHDVYILYMYSTRHKKVNESRLKVE